MEIGHEIARNALNSGAIKLRTDPPFLWASGTYMPIYNDNRRHLFSHDHRGAVLRGFGPILAELDFEIVAGTSTAGIPWATLIADQTKRPMIYIRDKPKGHGLKNQIEGIDDDKDLEGRKVIVIEDLISTGGSSARAVQAVRDANGVVTDCVAIFDYGLRNARDAFGALPEPCTVHSILTYDTLLEEANRDMSEEEHALLKDWRENPFGWAAKHGIR